MTAQTEEKPATRRPETGWATARRVRRAPAAPRTCLAAVATPGTPDAQPGPEGNIIRGED
ncbi:hypothetical protein GCM10010269_52800 [Streptomyces humidus]|uniref:Uncharacterized protein n=1 Tax=Streptomyces humidus TaxID=52259 RepID=A0A918L609_9ACTN|nr:hypothetical protein [Streptomyces humidus]GGS07153.1 hypothetical protein GCM10010269_52800 [Streptomyces humidus]